MITAVFVWYACISLTGLAALPLTFWLFERFSSRGLSFARPMGLLAASYVLWIGATLHIFQNNLAGVLVSLCVLAGLSLLVFKPGQLWPHIRAHARWWLASELIFAVAFIAWALVRATTADKILPAGGEKVMEIAFLNSILRSSPSFPPGDPWLAGQPISYYYFGYVMMAWMARLSQTPSSVAFSLYDALIYALSAQTAFGLASEMAALAGLGRRAKLLAGVASAYFLAGMGNLEGLLELVNARGWLPAAFNTWLGVPGFPPPGSSGGLLPAGAYWWWRASRVIQDLDLRGLAISASPITEFPFFSFLLGDNHPHLVALPFTLLTLAVALDWSLSAPVSWKRLGPAVLLIGGLLFLNTWDFPIYVLLALSSLYLGAHLRGEAPRGALNKTLPAALGLFLGAPLLYLPFLLNFHSQAGGILPYIFRPTRLPQYLLLFTPFLLLALAFLTYWIRHTHPGKSSEALRWTLIWWLRTALAAGVFSLAILAAAASVLFADQMRGGQLAQSAQVWLGGADIFAGILRVAAARLADPWLFLMLTLLIGAGLACLLRVRDTSPHESVSSFVILLMLAGFCLTFFPELLYLRDIFGVRMNTVFKFYFQAETLLCIASAFAAAWLWQRVSKPGARRLLIALYLTILIAGLIYPLASLATRTAAFSTPPTLDSSATLRSLQPDEFEAIDWLSAHAIPGSESVLLEAPCPSYCEGGLVSAFSGIPTVLGWYNHEVQWRGGTPEITRRLADINAIYTTATDADTLRLLRQYHVSYLIFGPPERTLIASACNKLTPPCSPEASAARLERILRTTFHNGSITIYLLPD